MKYIIYYILKLYVLYMKSFSNETLTFLQASYILDLFKTA